MHACVLDASAPIDSLPLRFTEIAKPAPAPGEVLIRVRACGVCRTDLHVVQCDLPRGGRLGLYGFGAAAHVAIQVARHWGLEVYAFTRDSRHQELARELGAAWVGGATADPPARLNAAILFAPAGELVPVALQSLKKGGTLVFGGIHMRPIPSLPYG